jgi:hypothetical protein
MKNQSYDHAYHLEIVAYSGRFGSLLEKGHYQAELFFSHEEARQRGKEILATKIRKLYETSEYYAAKETLEDFLDEANYSFTITDIDLAQRRDSAGYKRKEAYWRQRPAHVEYAYDYAGALLQRTYIYRRNYAAFDSSGVYYQNWEGDDAPEAGTKFQIGDFVRLMRPAKNLDGSFGTDTVFVVTALPKRDKEGWLIENTYRIETISARGEYQWDSDFHHPFSGIHENMLVKHEGEIAKDSPLWFLRRVFLGEFAEVEGIVQNMERGEIALTPNITWEELLCGSI